MQFDAFQADALARLSAISDLSGLEQLKVELLGKKGLLTEKLKGLSLLSPEERPKMGQLVNQVKEVLMCAFAEKEQALEALSLKETLEKDRIDITLSGRGQEMGRIHPIAKSLFRIKEILMRLGFSAASGPEIEDDFHNFEALNIPASHPARDSHDTFYFDSGKLLRTHTSTIQIRAMEKKQSAPIHIFAAGRVYRCDSDLTHTPMFHQVEGLWIDKNVSFGHLKGVLEVFLREFFEEEVKIRLRPSFFPFTEPSAEVDISCVSCSGKGCRICKQSGWLEVLGCGMVHPNVLKSVQIDSQLYQGFAFGMGIERLTMLRYKMTDLRMLYENDVRFLQQF
jgi:phenylalanyl-tRNA synthetase alpha chain